MTNRRSKSMLFLFSMQKRQDAAQEHSPVRLTESADLCLFLQENQAETGHNRISH